MPHITPTPAAASGWQDFDFEVIEPADTLRASIHPDGQRVTLSYWGGESMVVNASHLDDLIGLIQCAKAAL